MNQPATEFLSNQIAQYLGLKVPKFSLILFEDKRDTFVCENFMQEHSGSDLVHIYRYLKTPDQFSCEGLLRVLEDPDFLGVQHEPRGAITTQKTGETTMKDYVLEWNRFSSFIFEPLYGEEFSAEKLLAFRKRLKFLSIRYNPSRTRRSLWT